MPAGDRLDPVSAGLTVVEDACRGGDTVVTVSGLPAKADVHFLVQWDHLKAGPVQTAWAEPRFLYVGHMYVLYVSSLASAGSLVAEGTRLGLPGC